MRNSKYWLHIKLTIIVVSVSAGSFANSLPGDRSGSFENIAPCVYDSYEGCRAGPAKGVHWEYVGGDLEAATPASSSSIAVNKMIRQTIVTKARPRSEKRPAATEPAPDQSAPTESMPLVGRLNSGSADIFYNTWEVGLVEGQTFGVNPSVTWGDTYDLTLTLPLHFINPKSGDSSVALGLDSAFKYPLSGKMKNFMVGIHFYGMGFLGEGDTTSSFGGGPFIGYSYRMSDDWIVSGGLLFEITKPSESDTITEIVPAVNIGYNLSDNTALNGYLIHFMNQDSDVGDDAYTDIGADVAWIRGTWSLSAGIKTTAGLDNVDSTEIYLGSNWMF